MLVKYALPSVMSMVSVFLFTIIDGIFTGRGVGTDALGAVNLAFPFIMVFSALVMLVTVGGMTITAIRIGRGDDAGAEEAFLNATLIAGVISTVFCLLSVCFSHPIARMLGANDTYEDMAAEYLFWYGVFMIPCGLCMTLNGFCRNDRAPVLVSTATVIATTLNIFGDWLTIFPLGMGLKGAAIATGAAQTVGLLIVMPHFIQGRGVLRFGRFRLSSPMIGKCVMRGMPECVSQFCVPICVILTNQILITRLGDAAVNAYSLIGYVTSFAAAVFLGVAEGLQPLFGQCYGQKNEIDLKYYLRMGLIIGIAGAAVITCVLPFVWDGVCDVFGVDEATRQSSVKALLPYIWGFLVQAPNVIVSSYLYSTTRTRQALVINVLRSFAVNTAAILLLPAVFGAEAIWLTFGVYEGIVLIAAVILLIRADRRGVFTAAAE